MLALLAGVLSDRVNRKVWLILLQSAACALGAGLAIAAFLGKATPWLLSPLPFWRALSGPSMDPFSWPLCPASFLEPNWAALSFSAGILNCVNEMSRKVIGPGWRWGDFVRPNCLTQLATWQIGIAPSLIRKSPMVC